jgi:NAD(P)-dependent dehydrogenase (short-subunit alcohol dehydrogenase family)
VALVTGAGSGVGRCISLRLARAGFDVGVHFHHSTEQAEALAKQITALDRRAELFSADLNEHREAEGLVEVVAGSMGRVDVLVNNAAIFEPDVPTEVDPDLWDRTMRVNVRSPAILSEALFRHVRARGGGGRIVNICDIAAERPWRGYHAYSASKAGLVALTRATARSMAPHVQVNAVSPGIVEGTAGLDPDRLDRVIGRIPLGRVARPSDVAEAVLFFAIASDYITGQILCVDGGRSIA